MPLIPSLGPQALARRAGQLIQNLKSKMAPAPSVALQKKVKQPMVCHPERSEGSLQLFSP
jgi:hypothetical protein